MCLDAVLVKFLFNLHCQSIMDVEACKNVAPEKKVDCRWGKWDWAPCSVTCGKGIQKGIKRVEVPAQKGGKPCTPSVLYLVDERPCNKRCPRKYFFVF